jgi:hypothetical protein
MRSIIASVRIAGVGHPVGVFGVTPFEDNFPLMINSASNEGTNRLFCGLSPAPETPGIVDTRLFARMSANIGISDSKSAMGETKDIITL